MPMFSSSAPRLAVICETLSLWPARMQRSPVTSQATSQGGYLICATHKPILNGAVCSYHLLDWRSFRLPHVARSTLAAEGQAAAEAADNLHFAVTFWRAILDASYRIDGSEGCFAWPHPCILALDSKCLYHVVYHRSSTCPMRQTRGLAWRPWSPVTS